MIILKITEIVYILIELFFVAKLDYKEKIIKNQSILRILYFGVLFLVLRVIFYKTPIFYNSYFDAYLSYNVNI